MTRAITARAMGSPQKARGGFLDTLMDFVKWSQGRQDLESTLQSIASYIGAEAAILSRREAGKPGSRVAGVSDPTNDVLSPRLTRSFAGAIWGKYIDSIRPGTAMLLSDAIGHSGTCDPDLEQWMYKRGVIDIASICLSAENGVRDILEFHYTRPVPSLWHAEQETISLMLHDVYQGRQRGLMIQTLLRSDGMRRFQKQCTENRPLLGPDNPVGLTRSEWRVCVLIANGLSRDGIARELAVKPGTVRTHLRNIYSKTGYERFHELALRLVSKSERVTIGHLEEDQAA